MRFWGVFEATFLSFLPPETRYFIKILSQNHWQKQRLVRLLPSFLFAIFVYSFVAKHRAFSFSYQAAVFWFLLPLLVALSILKRKTGDYSREDRIIVYIIHRQVQVTGKLLYSMSFSNMDFEWFWRKMSDKGLSEEDVNILLNGSSSTEAWFENWVQTSPLRAQLSKRLLATKLSTWSIFNSE